MVGMTTKNVVAITGHRAESIPDEKWTRQAIRDSLVQMQASMLIQGMANGVDLWSAAEAWHAGIPFTSAKPWEGHTAGKKWENAYQWVSANSKALEAVSPSLTYPGVYIYHARNKWMVDRADSVLAVWDGRTNGGTFQCIQYAIQEEKPIYRINPKTRTIEGWVFGKPVIASTT